MSGTASRRGDGPAPAPPLRAAAALAALELRLLLRRGESILVTLVVPVAVLLFFGGTSIITVAADPVPSLVPGTIALGIVASGLVSLGISTAYERHYGVLKRLGGAPVPRWAFVAAKLATVLALEVVQLAVILGAAALAFGWAPGPAWQPAMLVAAIVLGTAAFVALGLVLAGSLRAEAVLALANGLFLAFLMLGGVVLPIDHLPAVLQPLAAALPSSALADLLRHALDSGTTAAATDPATALAVLAAWAVAPAVLAVRVFRWD